MGREALVAVLGRKRRGEARVSLGFDRGWLKGGGGLALDLWCADVGQGGSCSLRALLEMTTEKTEIVVRVIGLRAERRKHATGGLLRLGREKE
jgi:hypothetical protein